MKLFPTFGEMNTDEVLGLALQITHDRQLKHLVVASTTGDTGLKVAKLLTGVTNVIVVAHSFGHGQAKLSEKGKTPLWANPEMIKNIEDLGAKIYIGTTVFEGMEKAIRKQTGYSQGKLIADTLRLFGEGAKVCVEIVVSAVDAGLVPEGAEVICVAGTGSGADTAMIIKAAPSERFFNLEVIEYLAKPRNRKQKNGEKK